MPWRADGRCGTEVFAPDGSRPARCNPWHPDGSTCCSAAGWCGRSKDHCLCPKCVNYQIREPWRKDGRCGDEVEGKDGTKPAQCNPLDALNRTCCSDVGWCGGSKEHCLCRDCLHFAATCNCGPAAPCKDAYSGLCYPRTETADVWAEDEAGFNESTLEDFRVSGLEHTHDSMGRPLDPRNLAINMDRRPEYDPRGGSMKNQMLLEKHDPKFVALARRLGDSKAHVRGRGLHHVTQQPAVMGMRCAAPLVDCVGADPKPPPPPPKPPPSSPSLRLAAPDNGRSGASKDELRRLEEKVAAGMTSQEILAEIRRMAAEADPKAQSAPRPGAGSPTPPQPPPSTKAAAPHQGNGEPKAAPADAADAEASATILKPKHKQTAAKLPVRLANGETDKEGRVEVFFDGQWGSVCDADWDWADARVVCKQLGFKGLEGTTYQAAYGEGKGPIWLSNVECTGHEASLLDCTFYGLNQSMVTPACSHHRSDAGVVCSNEPMPTRSWAEAGKRAGQVREKARERAVHAAVEATGHVGQIVDITDLRGALANLERVILLMEVERPIIDDRDLSRMARLRMRLTRLAGRREPPSECNCDGASSAAKETTSDKAGPSANESDPDEKYAKRAEAQRRQQQKDQEERDAELGITDKMKRELGPELLASLRAMPRRKEKSLEETKKEFEEKPYDPFENDPVAKYLRNRPEPSYVPPGMEPKPLRPRTPEEPLLKPPITTRSDRVISRDVQMRWLKEETERAVKEGRAGPEMLRTVGPGPWDHDEAFWSSPYDSGVHLPRPLVTPWHLDCPRSRECAAVADETFEWELEDDITFPG